MLKSVVVSSVLPDSFEAGKDVGGNIKKQLSKPNILFVYASCDYDLSKMISGIKEMLPDTPIIGNTSFTGIITPDGFVGGDNGFVGVMALEDSDICVKVAGIAKSSDARAHGKEVALKAMGELGKPAYFHMVSSPGEEEYYLKGITDIVGRIPFFGGSAADNTIAGKWSLFTGDGVCADGVAVALFYSKKPITNYFTGAYHETKDIGIITKMEGDRKIVEIDGVPSVKKYASWVNKKPDDLLGMSLLVETVVSPLGVKDRLGDLIAIRHPMNGNDDYSMNVGNKLSEGTAVIRMACTVDELIQSPKKAIENLKKRSSAPFGALHLVHCGGRRAGIGDRIDEVAKVIKDSVGDIPFIVEFTFGEYGYEDDGINTCGGLMLSFTGFQK